MTLRARFDHVTSPISFHIPVRVGPTFYTYYNPIGRSKGLSWSWISVSPKFAPHLFISQITLFSHAPTEERV